MIRKISETIPFIGAALLLAVLMVGVSHSSKVEAQAADGETVTPGICRAAIVFDRSGSVGTTNMNTLRLQTQRLFEPGGLESSKIEIAFWSFANNAAYFSRNYNEPFNDFVPSNVVSSAFNRNLARLTPMGFTNYEHALAYSNGDPNSNIQDIVDRTDLIVFLTDGEPNPESSRNPARQAALRHYSAGREIIGGLIGTRDRDMNYVLNGSNGNNTNTFRVSTNYNDLSEKLKEKIGEKCLPRVTPDPCPFDASIPIGDPRCVEPVVPYSLSLSVVAATTIVSGADDATFNYAVNNSSDSASQQTDWSIKRLVVGRGQSVAPLSYNASETYRDNMSCAQLVALVGGASRASCGDAAQGSRVFPSGNTTLSDAEAGAAALIEVDDSLEVGSKLCYVLTLSKPTDADSPVDRYSRAACITVGKKPSVQVHGDDIIVGRYYRGESSTESSGAKIQTSITAKAGSVNRTYGSWSEYGAFAPGLITGLASASGLEGGIARGAGDLKTLSSKLTFANVGDTNGYFSQYTETASIPDTANYLLRGREVVDDIAALSDWSPTGKVSGLYQKNSGDLRIDAGTIAKGRSVLLNVPNGTVTIAGNVQYENEGYRSLAELPQLIVIAKNIVITGDVTNVDAWLIAKNGDDGAGGRVTTCDVTGPLSSEICNQTLQVNGPVMSNQLLLRRTGGAGAGAASGRAAEVFNLRPSVYLWANNVHGSAQRVETTYTKELPPRF